MNPQDIQYLPDEVLASAVKSPNGQIPSWMALAEVNKRSQVRNAATANSQVSQSTVADEVLGALRQSGMPVQPQSQQMAPSPSNAQPMASQNGFAKGGIIKMADGGQVPPDPMDSVGGIMGVPKLNELNPADYQVQYQAPQYVDPAQVEQKIKDRFGSGVDYSPMLSELDQLKSQIHPFSRKDAIRNLGFALMSNKEQNPLVAFGQSALGVQGMEQSQNAGNNKMLESIMDKRIKIMQDQQERSDKIAGAIDQNENLLNQRALTESTQKNAFNERNSNVAKDIAEHNNTIKEQQFALAKDVATQLKDPVEVANLLNHANGILNDPNASPQDKSKAASAVDLLNKASQNIWGSKQKASDIELNKEKDLAGFNFANQKSLEAMREAHADKMLKEQQNPSGNASSDAQQADRDMARTAFIREFSFGQRPVIPRGKEANAFLSMMRQEGDRWMKENNFTPGDAGTQQAQYKAQADAMRHVSDTAGMTEGRENAMYQQAPIIMGIASRIKRTGIPVIDEKYINAKSGAGDADAQLIKNWMNTFAFEYSNLNAGSGQSTNALRDDAHHMFLTGLNNGQLDAVLKAALQEGETRKKGFRQTMDSMSNNIGNIGKSGNPVQSPVQSGIPLSVKAPNGKTYRFNSKSDMDNFKKAAGLQ